MLPGDYSVNYFTIGEVGGIDPALDGWSDRWQGTAEADVPPPPPPSAPVYDQAPTAVFDAAIADESYPVVITDDVGDMPYNEAVDVPPAPGDVRLSSWVPSVVRNINNIITTVSQAAADTPPPTIAPTFQTDTPPDVYDINALGVQMFGRGWYGTPEQVAQLPRPKVGVSPSSPEPVAVVTLRPISMIPTPELSGERSIEQRAIEYRLAAGVQPVGRPVDPPEKRVSPMAIIAVGAAVAAAIFLSRG